MAFECFLLILLLFCPLASSFPLMASLNEFPLLASLRNERNAEDPMFCTEIFVNHTFLVFKPDKQDFPNITIHTKMALFHDNDETNDLNIRISDFYGLDITDNLTAFDLCYDNINAQCNQNVTTPIDFDLNEFDPLILITTDFWKDTESGATGYGDGFYAGYFINGSFLPLTGNLFSQNVPCSNVVVKYKDIQKFSTTSCCTKFYPAPKAPPAPACKKFQSTLTFYNGNNTVFAETMMTYTLKDGNLHTEGNYTILPEYPHPAYFFNILTITGLLKCGSEEDPQLKCIIPLTPGDSSLFILMAYSRLDFEYPFSDLRAANVGTIIFRNGQTLMYEGTPFTPENACVSYTGHNYANKPSISKFCCIEFE